MPRSAIVVFTGRPVEEILDPRIMGSGDWRLDMARAREAEFLVCTRNRHSADFPPTAEPHRAAFLIGRKRDIVRSPTRADRWLIRISDYVRCIIPDVWGKSGQIHLRYPVWYTTLEDVGIDLAALPPAQKLLDAPPAVAPADVAGATLTPSRPWTPHPGRRRVASDQPARARLDAILAQLDRIPDLPAPADPLDWDEHGVPR
jgi:hypothetical protein